MLKNIVILKGQLSLNIFIFTQKSFENINQYQTSIIHEYDILLLKQWKINS